MKWPRGIFVSGVILALAIFAASRPVSQAQTADSNRLWLEMALTNDIAWLTLHLPATNANGTYDLFFKTNLGGNEGWTWVLRNGPGQTNPVLTNLPAGQGFFQLGVTNAIRPGFDQQVLGPNDDESTDRVPIGFPVIYFGSTNTTLYVNNNGNVTFDSAQGAYTPTPLNNLGIKIIAPYWADVDTRNPASDVVRYGTNTVNGRRAFAANWVNVGYFSWHVDLLLSCQLVIIDRSDIGSGDFDMEFNYYRVQWQLGDASKTSPPRVGYSDGSNDFELPGSGLVGSFVDTNVLSGLIYHSLNNSVPGRYVFYFRDGLPVP
jgi:hypothetical protein